MLAGWPKTANQNGRLSGYPLQKNAKGSLGMFPTTLRSEVKRANPLHPINAGLVGWWPCDEGAGTRLRDLSIYGNHMTISGTPRWVTRNNDAAHHEVDTADWASAPDSTSLSINGNKMTLMAWARPIDAGGRTICGKWHAASHTSPYFKYGLWAFGQLEFRVDSSISDSGAATLPSGVWSHVCGLYDGSYIYSIVNGIVKASTGKISNVQTSAQPFALGRNASGFENWQSSLQHVRLYNRALSLTEIALIMTDPWIGTL